MLVRQIRSDELSQNFCEALSRASALIFLGRFVVLFLDRLTKRFFFITNIPADQPEKPRKARKRK